MPSYTNDTSKEIYCDNTALKSILVDVDGASSVMDLSYWTDALVGYNLFRDRRGHDGTTAQIYREVQDPDCP
jgi:hypothetical protein